MSNQPSLFGQNFFAKHLLINFVSKKVINMMQNQLYQMLRVDRELEMLTNEIINILVNLLTCDFHS